MSQAVDSVIAHRDKVRNDLVTELKKFSDAMQAISNISLIDSELAHLYPIYPCWNASITINGDYVFVKSVNDSIKEQRLIELCNTPCCRYKA